MKKYMLAGVVAVALLLVSGSAFAASRFATTIPHAILIGAVEVGPKKDAGIYRFYDGDTACYVLAGELPTISCVK